MTKVPLSSKTLRTELYVFLRFSKFKYYLLLFFSLFVPRGFLMNYCTFGHLFEEGVIFHLQNLNTLTVSIGRVRAAVFQTNLQRHLNFGIFSHFSRAFFLLYFIVTCLNLYFISSCRSLLSLISLKSFNPIGTL